MNPVLSGVQFEPPFRRIAQAQPYQAVFTASNAFLKIVPSLYLSFGRLAFKRWYLRGGDAAKEAGAKEGGWADQAEREAEAMIEVRTCPMCAMACALQPAQCVCTCLSVPIVVVRPPDMYVPIIVVVASEQYVRPINSSWVTTTFPGRVLSRLFQTCGCVEGYGSCMLCMVQWLCVWRPVPSADAMHEQAIGMSNTDCPSWPCPSWPCPSLAAYDRQAGVSWDDASVVGRCRRYMLRQKSGAVSLAFQTAN